MCARVQEGLAFQINARAIEICDSCHGLYRFVENCVQIMRSSDGVGYGIESGEFVCSALHLFVKQGVTNGDGRLIGDDQRQFNLLRLEKARPAVHDQFKRADHLPADNHRDERISLDVTRREFLPNRVIFLQRFQVIINDRRDIPP